MDGEETKVFKEVIDEEDLLASSEVFFSEVEAATALTRKIEAEANDYNGDVFTHTTHFIRQLTNRKD